MPIKIPNDLPARATLEQEGVMVMTEDTAARQDIRPLRIGLLNLMPNKIRTETQFARLVGATPLQVEMTLVKITTHTPKNTPADHMIAFYRNWESVRHEKFDGLIVTGAPVELLEFESVTYWDELRRIFDWTQTNVHSSINICWGAQASLHHFHGVPKHALPKKPSAFTATAISIPPRPICAASPMISPFRFRAGPKCAAPTCPPTQRSRC